MSTRKHTPISLLRETLDNPTTDGFLVCADLFEDHGFHEVAKELRGDAEIVPVGWIEWWWMNWIAVGSMWCDGVMWCDEHEFERESVELAKKVPA